MDLIPGSNQSNFSSFANMRSNKIKNDPSMTNNRGNWNETTKETVFNPYKTELNQTCNLECGSSEIEKKVGFYEWINFYDLAEENYFLR